MSWSTSWSGSRRRVTTWLLVQSCGGAEERSAQTVGSLFGPAHASCPSANASPVRRMVEVTGEALSVEPRELGVAFGEAFVEGGLDPTFAQVTCRRVLPCVNQARVNGHMGC